MVPDPSRLARAGVVIPIRAFAVGKARLSETLEAAPRAELAEWMADQVLAAAKPLPVVIVSSADDVRTWAGRHGVTVLDDPGDLDRAAAVGVAWCSGHGLARRSWLMPTSPGPLQAPSPDSPRMRHGRS